MSSPAQHVVTCTAWGHLQSMGSPEQLDGLLFGSMVKWLVGCLNGLLDDYMVGWMHEWLVGCFIGWLYGYMVGLMVKRLAGWINDWLYG